MEYSFESKYKILLDLFLSYFYDEPYDLAVEQSRNYLHVDKEMSTTIQNQLKLLEKEDIDIIVVIITKFANKFCIEGTAEAYKSWINNLYSDLFQ